MGRSITHTAQTASREIVRLATFLNLPRFFRNVKDAIVSNPLKIAFHIANVLMVLIAGLFTLPVLSLLGFGARGVIGGTFSLYVLQGSQLFSSFIFHLLSFLFH